MFWCDGIQDKYYKWSEFSFCNFSLFLPHHNLVEELFATKNIFKHYNIKSLTEPVNEEQLLIRIKKNPKEFGVLFDLYYKRILGYALRRTLSYDLSKDITAETFLKAFLKIKGFRWKGISISSWLYKIATNEINYYYRKQKYSPASLDELLDNNEFDLINKEGLEEERDKIEQELKSHYDFIVVQKKLEKLPPKYQEVIALKYFEEKSIKEISEILEKKEGTIKSLISRGLQKLRESLQNY